jgi:hypothetical protein
MDSWEAEVWYDFARNTPVTNGGTDPTTPDGPEFEFDIGTQQVKFTQAIAQEKYSPTGGATAPDFGLAINVTSEGVDGVEVPIGTYTFSERHEFASTYVTPEYKAKVFRCAGKVNNAAFKGFQAGEVLFLGCKGSKRGKQPWQLEYRFAASENLTGATIGSFTGVSKKGHEYMWFSYEDDTDDTAHTLIKKPRGAYVATVIKSADFADLGIGTT